MKKVHLFILLAFLSSTSFGQLRLLNERGGISSVDTIKAGKGMVKNTSGISISDSLYSSTTDLLKSFQIACFGNSLTAGAGASPSASMAYPAQLTTLSGYTTINRGIGGETSAQIKARFDTSTSIRSLPTVFWVAENDGSDTSATSSNLQAMLTTLATNNYLVVSRIVPSGAGVGTSVYPRIISWNASQKHRHGVRFANVDSLLKANYNPLSVEDVEDVNNGIVPRSLRVDEIHLNNAGYTLVANYIKTLLSYLTGFTQPFVTSSVMNYTLSAPPAIGKNVPSEGYFTKIGIPRYKANLDGDIDIDPGANNGKVRLYANAANAELRLLSPYGSGDQYNMWRIRGNQGSDNRLSIYGGARATVGSESLTELFSFLPTGNFGIGTINPVTPLHISNPSTTGAEDQLATLMKGANNTGADGSRLTISNFLTNGVRSLDLVALREGGSYASTGVLRVNSGSAPASMVDVVTMKSTGRVGIGNSSPSFKLDVNGDARFSTSIQTIRASVDSIRMLNSDNLYFRNQAGNVRAVMSSGGFNFDNGVDFAKIKMIYNGSNAAIKLQAPFGSGNTYNTWEMRAGQGAVNYFTISGAATAVDGSESLNQVMAFDPAGKATIGAVTGVGKFNIISTTTTGAVESALVITKNTNSAGTDGSSILFQNENASNNKAAEIISRRVDATYKNNLEFWTNSGASISSTAKAMTILNNGSIEAYGGLSVSKDVNSSSDAALIASLNTASASTKAQSWRYGTAEFANLFRTSNSVGLIVGSSSYDYPLLQLTGTGGSWKFQMQPSGSYAFTDVSTNNNVLELAKSAPTRSIYVNGSGVVSNAVSTTTPLLGVGVTTPHASAAVEISHASRGFLPPRMTYTAMTAIPSPAEGLIVYATDTHKLYCYDGTGWQACW